MIKYLFFIPLILTTLIFGIDSSHSQEEDPMVIESGEAEYNGKEISLNGNVIVHHELGKVMANQLVIIPSTEKGKKKKFSFLKMKENIKIESKDGGCLTCQEAEIDYAHLKGIFLGNPEQSDVIYKHYKAEVDTNKNPSFILKSDQMEMKLIRSFDSQSQSHKSSIRQIQAKKHVRAYYNQNYLILADLAIYDRITPDQTDSTYESLLLSVEDSNNGVCQIINQNGDTLQSNHVTIDLRNRQLTCSYPKGSLRTGREGENKEPILFSSENLVWNEADNVLSLRKNVKFDQVGFGSLRTNQEIQLHQSLVNDEKKIHSIISLAETEMTYLDEENKLTHKILCHGPLTIDHEHFIVIMKSPTDNQGNITQENQVYFEDLAGEIWADELQLKYQLDGHRLIPLELAMQGHVKILNRFDGHLQESGSVLQYALADNVTYFSKSKEMILSSKGGNRALFFDKVNHLQISAPTLKIFRDIKTNKSSFQGIGDVRFTFIEHEFDQLKERFQLEEQPIKAP